MIEESSILNFPELIKKNLESYEFAGVVATTRMAAACQKAVREEMDKEFTIRRPYTKQSIKIKPATMQDKESEVYTELKILREQEEGAQRSPVEKKKGQFNIPDKLYELTGADSKKIIQKRIAAGHIINMIQRGEQPPKIGPAGNRPFIMTTKSGHKGLVIRRGPEKFPVDELYAITQKNIKINKRPFFEKTIEKIFSEQMESIFNKAVEEYIEKSLRSL